MKTIILQLSLAVVICIFTANSAPDNVLDSRGKNLRAGVKYYVRPAYGDGYNGGLILAQVGNKSCPAAVAQLGVGKGLSLTFSPVNPKEGLIRVSTDVNIKLSGPTSCNESNVWRLKYNEVIKEYAVMVGGVEGNPGQTTLNNWFKIEKSTYNGYKFVFCPSVCSYCKVMCTDVYPLITDASEAGLPLILWNITNFPFSVIFYRA